MSVSVEINTFSSAQSQQVAAMVPLFQNLNDLKRIRAAHLEGSFAERLFLRAWTRLCRGEDLALVAAQETARSLIATQLADIDAAILASGGVETAERRAIMERAFDAATGALEPAWRGRLQSEIGALSDEIEAETTPAAPPFSELLARQPRAGATRPGYARVVLEPAENHAQHCAIVAVGGAIVAPFFGAAPEEAFLTGLCHHFHNAYLPDAGDAGDHLLGDALKTLQATFSARAIAQLPTALQGRARAALEPVFRSDTPVSRAFQTADVLDRVLEMDWHARSAAFTLTVALDEMDIVHPGPVQAFQAQIMNAARLR